MNIKMLIHFVIPSEAKRSREWSGWGSRDIDAKGRRLREREVSESNL
jgi:hypothetical protein